MSNLIKSNLDASEVSAESDKFLKIQIPIDQPASEVLISIICTS